MNKETTASNKQANKNKKRKKCTNTKEYVTRQNKQKKERVTCKGAQMVHEQNRQKKKETWVDPPL